MSEYIVNPAGAKVPFKYTKSFDIFIDESGTMEFFLMYVLLAEHANKAEFINLLKEHYKNDINKASVKLVEFIEADNFDSVFDINTYELYFGQMAYTRLTDNALSYFKDVLVEVVRKKPNIIKSNEKEPLDYILSFDTMDELINDLTEKKIKKLFYGSITDIKKFFDSRLGIKLFKNQESEDNFNQLVKQRNLIVHNRGIITQELADEFSCYEKLIGQNLLFKFKQLSDINIIINNIIVEIDIQLRNKFNLDTFSTLNKT